ncbi:MAG: Holliday junction resolvase RuvX [Patescibacteria group bacterium]
MKILAIDYGQSKIGIAFADTIIAEPYCVLRYQSEDKVIKKIFEIMKILDVEKVIVGISEGKSAENSKDFAKKLLAKKSIDLEFVDETLSTKIAQEYSIEAGIRRSKRKLLEDAYAATVMLQWYIEKNV